MNISPINFTARTKCIKKGQVMRRHDFKAPHNNVPYPTNKHSKLGPKKVNSAFSQKDAEIYAEQMEDMLSKNPNNSIARMLLKEYTKIL